MVDPKIPCHKESPGGATFWLTPEGRPYGSRALGEFIPKKKATFQQPFPNSFNTH
jgi:hypothetical protein